MSLSLEQTAKVFDGKSVLIVGNAPVKLYPERKPDVLVRINMGFLSDCDIWADHLVPPDRIRPPESWNGVILRHSIELGLAYQLKGFPVEWEDRTYFASRETFHQIRTDSGVDRPTTGLITILWVLRYASPSKLWITGFDFFKTGVAVRVHEPKKEEKLVGRLVEQGELEHLR